MACLETAFVIMNPTVIISGCLSGRICRWDGKLLDTELFRSLQTELNLVPFCPECQLGLGIPRPTIRLIRKSLDNRTADNIELVQPQTGRILTPSMDALCESFLRSNPASGYVLKYKSPSCGLSNVKVYLNAQSQEICGFEQGRFAAAVRRLFPNAPVIDDFRIQQPELRRRWLDLVRRYAENLGALR